MHVWAKGSTARHTAYNNTTCSCVTLDFAMCTCTAAMSPSMHAMCNVFPLLPGTATMVVSQKGAPEERSSWHCWGQDSETVISHRIPPPPLRLWHYPSFGYPGSAEPPPQRPGGAVVACNHQHIPLPNNLPSEPITLSHPHSPVRSLLFEEVRIEEWRTWGLFRRDVAQGAGAEKTERACPRRKYIA